MNLQNLKTFFTPQPSPFASEEEALAFIAEKGKSAFGRIMLAYATHMINVYIAIVIFAFPLYIGLAAIVLLFDYKFINYQTYLFLCWLKIPVQNPEGWNISLILSFLICTALFIWIRRLYNFSIFKKLTIIKISIKYIFRFCFSISVIIFLLFVTMIATLPVQSNACTATSLCWMHSDSMFFYSSFLLYGSFLAIFCLIHTIFYHYRFNFDYAKIKEGL